MAPCSRLPCPAAMGDGLRLARFSELAASFRVRVFHRNHESATSWTFRYDLIEAALPVVQWATVFDELGLGGTGYSPVRHAHESSPWQMIARACHRHGCCFPSVHRLCDILLHRPTCEQACTVSCNRYPRAASTGTRTERRSSSPASTMAPGGASKAGSSRSLYTGIA